MKHCRSILPPAIRRVRFARALVVCLGLLGAILEQAAAAPAQPAPLQPAADPAPPTISAPPTSRMVNVGESFTLSVTAAGSPDPTYQWRKDGSMIDAATSDTYSVTAATTADAGAYDVIVSNSEGIVASDPAQVTVNTPPVFTSTPITLATVGHPYSYTITATDADVGDTVAFAAPSNPNWLGVFVDGDGRGALSGTPGAANIGAQPVVIRVTDGKVTVEQRFTITVSADAGPTIAAIADQDTFKNTPTTAIAFTISDVDDAVAALTVTAQAANPALVPATGIVLAGDGANRTLTITPAAGRIGTTTMTVRVSDDQRSASTSFSLSVSDPFPEQVFLPLIVQTSSRNIPAPEPVEPPVRFGSGR